jgi:hypothetical protein
MLFDLDHDVLNIIAGVFRARILNHATEDDNTSWDEFCVQLLQKKASAVTIKHFRPISIVPVLSKLYSRVLLLLAGTTIKQLKAPQFAFRSGYQAHEVVYILRSMIEKSLEWGIPILVLDGDIHKAYDFVSHQSCLEALLLQGVPGILVSAWIREVRRSKSIFKFGSNTQSKPVRRTRSLLQGDPAAPDLFNSTLDVPASEFLQWCFSHGYGVELESDFLLSLVLYADILWIFATSPSMMQIMTEKWFELLSKHGWEVPVQEATWCTTAPDEHVMSVLVNGVRVNRSPRADGFKAVGTTIAFNNAFKKELADRLARAWRAFYKYKRLLMSKLSPIGRRLQFLCMLVESTLFYCAGSWNLKATQLSQLRGAQQDMIRKMLRIKRPETESMPDYCIRCARTVRHVMETHGIEPWDAHYHRLVFKWAGHICRMNSYDPSRVTSKVLNYKNWSWIRTVAAQNAGNQLHCRRLRTWRWERPLYKFFEGRPEMWEHVASDKVKWINLLDEMVTWRCHNR